MVQRQVEYEIEGIGGDITADHGELDEAIVDIKMEIDDEEYKTFLACRDTRLFDKMIPFPRIGATLTWMGSRLMMVMTVTWCIIKLTSKVDNCFMIRSTCNM